MLKRLMLVLSLVLFLIELFSGCTQNSNVVIDSSKDIEHIIGTWVNYTSVNFSGVNKSALRIYNFFTNNSFNYTSLMTIGENESTPYRHTLGTYELNNGYLIVSNTTEVKKATFKYTFGYNYTTLILTDSAKHSIMYVKMILS